MRSKAIGARAGGCASAASTAPAGGACAADEAVGAATRTAASSALAKRRTRLPVEEVELVHLDGDGHPVAEGQLNVRRVRRYEVRPRRSHPLAALLDVLLGLVGAGGPDRLGVDAEVRHGLGAERLDEVEPRLKRG